MKYAVEMSLGGIKIGSDIQKLIRGRHRQQDDLISLFFFSK
jgi:hypothetical protein